MNSNTTEGRPADLTVRGGIASLAGTLVFIFGGLAIEYVKSHSPDLSYSTKIVLAVLDVVVVCGVLGYLFLEAARMWDRFSYFVERVTTSSTWPRVKPAVGLAASALSVVILISIGLVAIYEALVVVQTAVPNVLEIIQAVVDKLGFGRYGVIPFKLPDFRPLSGWVVARIVFIALAGVWLLRLISYVLQRQWSASVE